MMGISRQPVPGDLSDNIRPSPKCTLKFLENQNPSTLTQDEALLLMSSIL